MQPGANLRAKIVAIFRQHQLCARGSTNISPPTAGCSGQPSALQYGGIHAEAFVLTMLQLKEVVVVLPCLAHLQ